MNNLYLVKINKLIKEYDLINDEFKDFNEIDKYKFIGLNYPYMSIFKNNIKYDELESKLLMLSFDKKFRLQYKYTKKHDDTQLNKKIIKIKNILNNYNDFIKNVDNDLQKENKLSFNKIYAAMTKIILLTGIRVGKDVYFNNTNTVGLSTLQLKHIFFIDNYISFEFIGKKNVFQKIIVKDKIIIDIIKELIKNKNSNDFIFTFNDRKIIYTDINNYIKKKINILNVSNKDFRTLLANKLFIENFQHEWNNNNDNNENNNIEKIIKNSIDFVASSLNNTKAVSKKSYIFGLINNFIKSKSINKINDFSSSIELLIYIINL